MRILKVETKPRRLVQAAPVQTPKPIQTVAPGKLSGPEMNTILQVKTQLSNVPGIAQMLQNPANLTFLMEFFQILNTNSNARGLILNAMSIVSNFMKKNPGETASVLTKG